MIVYVVTTGCYSDYSICGVFTEKEMAEIYCAILNSEARIEEYNTEYIKIETSKPVKKLWKFTLNPNKRICDFDFEYSFKNYNSITRNAYGDYYVCITLDKNIEEERAKKIMYDKLAEWEAKRKRVI